MSSDDDAVLCLQVEAALGIGEQMTMPEITVTESDSLRPQSPPYASQSMAGVTSLHSHLSGVA